MSAEEWTNERLYSDKHRRDVDVQYLCVRSSGGTLNIEIKPVTADRDDPPCEWYEARFVVEGDYVRAQMLDRHHMASLKGVTYALLKAVASCTGKHVRSSLRLNSNKPAEDGSDQLIDSGPTLWERLVGEQRARYDDTERRFYLL